MLQAVRWVTDYLAIPDVIIDPGCFYGVPACAGAGSSVGGINPEE